MRDIIFKYNRKKYDLRTSDRGVLKKIVLVASALLVIALLFAGQHIFFKSHGTPKLPEPPLNTVAAQHGIKLGNFAILTHLNDKSYTDILTSQFDFVLADNTPNWYFIGGGLRPTSTSYDFSKLDQVYAFAQAHNMPVQAHHYIWGDEKWLPDWLKKGNYSPDQLMTLIHDHIMTVGRRYAGQTREWTVVNEAFTREAHEFDLRDWWADHTGSQSYIDQSFIWARQADPSAKLIINDFMNESDNYISDAMYTYLKGAKTRGVPIDGIGMQMHIDGGHPPTKNEVIKNMQRFASLGVDVYVTEFDVNMNDVKANAYDKDQIEGNIYYEMMRACIESKVCHSFAILGITDSETWYNYIGLADPRPLPFDKNYQPKQAYWSLREALKQP